MAHSKSLERRLYEAYRAHRGIRLSRADLDRLLFDDALQTRITNEAEIEAGGEPGGNASADFGVVTWRELGGG